MQPSPISASELGVSPFAVAAAKGAEPGELAYRAVTLAAILVLLSSLCVF